MVPVAGMVWYVGVFFACPVIFFFCVTPRIVAGMAPVADTAVCWRCALLWLADMFRMVCHGQARGEASAGHLIQGGDGGQADERGGHAQVRCTQVIHR